MKFSLSDAGLNRFMTYEDEFDCIKNAGYDGVDFMLDRYDISSVYRTENIEQVQAYFKEIRSYADKAGLKIFQTHAPFPTHSENSDYENMITSLRNAIVATSVLGAEYVVIHPMMPTKWKLPCMANKRFEANIKFYKELEPIAEKYGVKIALENMFATFFFLRPRRCNTALSTTKEIIRMLDTLNSDNFGFCLDIGHFNLLRKDPINAIYELGSRITCVHLHDNNGIDDQHIAERRGNLDWDEICKALHDIGYKGVYNSEAICSIVEGGKEMIAVNMAQMYKNTLTLPYRETEE